VKRLLLSLGGLGLGLAHAAPVDRIAALVNDEVITLSQVYDLGRPHIEAASKGGHGPDRRSAEISVLEAEIRRVLIEQELVRLGVVVSEQDLERTLASIAAENNIEREALEAAVGAQGFTWAEYKNEVRRDLGHRKFQDFVIRPRIVENEDELRNAYNRMANSPDRPVEVELGAIFVARRDASEAEGERVRGIMIDIATRHAAGESFAALATEFDMAGYGQSGGSMGRFKQGDLFPLLDGPAFTVEIGQISEPLEGERGFFLLEIRQRELEQVLPFEAVRSDLSLKVFNAQFQREEDSWYQMARRESSVEVKLEDPEKL
jgi:peptidyl-prolyl cis-trans isomerase SurA